MELIPVQFITHRYRVSAVQRLYLKEKGLKEIDSEKNFQQWVGRKFGYPECCIIFFTTCWVNRPFLHGENPHQTRIKKNRAAIKVGYIPCPACMDKIEAGQEIQFGPRTLTIKL